MLILEFSIFVTNGNEFGPSDEKKCAECFIRLLEGSNRRDKEGREADNADNVTSSLPVQGTTRNS